MSAAVRSIPYAGPSPMPRTTGPQRVKYAAIAVEMRKELGDWEPYHSHRERVNSRLAQRAECVDLCPYSKASDGLSQTLLTIEHWRAHWRSLPDYDGGGNAPSGGAFAWVDPVSRMPVRPGYGGPVQLDVPLRRASIETKALERTEPDDGRKDEHGVVRYASWYMENFGGTRLITDCFDLPSKGGRGWCPKLAGVGK